MSFAALCASDAVIIPFEAADWGAQGVVHVAAAVEHVRSRYDPELALHGYLVSRFKMARSYRRSYLAKLRQHFGPLMLMIPGTRTDYGCLGNFDGRPGFPGRSLQPTIRSRRSTNVALPKG